MGTTANGAGGSFPAHRGPAFGIFIPEPLKPWLPLRTISKKEQKTRERERHRTQGGRGLRVCRGAGGSVPVPPEAPMPFWPWPSFVQCPSPVSPTGLGWSSYRLPGAWLPALPPAPAALSEPAGTCLPPKHPTGCPAPVPYTLQCSLLTMNISIPPPPGSPQGPCLSLRPWKPDL